MTPRPFDRLWVAPGDVEGRRQGILSREQHSLTARVVGIVRSPQATCQALIAEPRWVDVLALALVATTVCGAILFATDVGELALLDRWERTAIVFGQEVDAARYAALERASRYGAGYAVISALVGGPLLVVFTSAVLHAAFTTYAGGVGTFRQVLALVAHAGVILAVRQLVGAPVTYARETLASPMSARVLFTMLDDASPLANFVGTIDLFVVWWVVLLAVGISELYGRPLLLMAFAFVGAYFVLALIPAAVVSATGGTA